MTEFLTEEEQAERIKKWLKENGLSVVLLIVVSLGGVIGWWYYQEYRAEDRQEAANLYFDYVEARALGEPVEEQLDKLRDEHSNSTYLVYTLLYEAKEAVENEAYEEAIDTLAEAFQASSNDTQSDLIATRQARIEAEIERFDDALATLGRIKTEGFRALALEIQGDIYARQGNVSDARTAYIAAKDALNQGQSEDALLTKIASIPEQE